MKPLICPQCGAALEGVTIGTQIVKCSYCRAQVLIRPKGDDKNEFEASLVTRAEGGREEQEVYERDDLKFTKQRYQPNDTLRLAFLSRRKNERMRGFGIAVLVLIAVGLVFLAVYFN